MNGHVCEHYLPYWSSPCPSPTEGAHDGMRASQHNNHVTLDQCDEDDVVVHCNADNSIFYTHMSVPLCTYTKIYNVAIKKRITS